MLTASRASDSALWDHFTSPAETFLDLQHRTVSLLILNVGRPGVGQSRMFEIINVIAGEFNSGQWEKARPTDAVDPLAHSFVLARLLGIDVHQVDYRVHY